MIIIRIANSERGSLLPASSTIQSFRFRTFRKIARNSRVCYQAESPGARCVECNMPTRTYMVVDARRDHSIRIPRSGLSLKIGVPNACTGCHRDKPVCGELLIFDTNQQFATHRQNLWPARCNVGFTKASPT